MRRLVIILSVVALCGCNGRKSDDTSPTIDQGPDATFGMARHAAIVVMDGIRLEESYGDDETYGEGWSDAADAPTEDVLPLSRARLYDQGTLMRRALCAYDTVTTPAHVDLITGANTVLAQYPVNLVDPGPYRPSYPTLFEVAREQLSLEDDESVMLANMLNLTPIRASSHPAFGWHLQARYEYLEEDTDRPVVELVGTWLADGARLVVANMHQIDRAGHSNPEAYASTAAASDQAMVNLWHETILEDPDLKDDTLLALVSDHGRHRFEDTMFPWSEHGDACSGCREIPMILMGPGVLRDVENYELHTLQDLTATVSWLMGIEMPFMTGLIMTDVLVGEPEVTQRSGPANIHGSGSILAAQHYLSDFSNRSELEIDGEQVTDDTAMALEMPRVFELGDRAFACWRQLKVEWGEELYPWEPICRSRWADGEWEPVESPEETIWAHWTPSWAGDETGPVYLGYSANVSATVSQDGALTVAKLTEDGSWELSSFRSDTVGVFPSQTSIALRKGSIWMAYASSPEASGGYAARGIQVYRIDERANWSESLWERGRIPEVADSVGRVYNRQESPALYADEEHLYLAFIAYDGAEGTYLVTASQPTIDDDWSTQRSLDASGQVLPNVTPFWNAQGVLFWARHTSEGTAEVCQSLHGEIASIECVDTGRSWLQSVAYTDHGVYATVSDGGAQWELVEVSFGG